METTIFIPYVYKVTNIITGQFYIGMKVTPGEIGIDYFTSSTNKEFKSDFKKNPTKYFCEKLFMGDQQEVALKESELISTYKDDPLILNKAFNNNHLYIIADANERKIINKKISDATQKRAREHPETFPGRKNTDCSEETKKKISNSLKGRIPPNKGKPQSDEAKRKQSESMKGKTPWNKDKTGIYSDETRKRISIANIDREPPNKGKHASEETRKKLSDSHKGHSPSNKGRKASEETRKKLSESHKGQIAHNTGKHCYTDGKHNIYAFECPVGFKPGMAPKHLKEIDKA